MPTPQPTPTPTRAPGATGDYDADDDGLIEVSNLAQLNAIRFDLDGGGSAGSSAYIRAFHSAMSGMGCPTAGCNGYELISNLDLSGTEWVPIGDSDHRFNTTFDGNGHIVSNMSMTRSEAHSGLFGYTDTEGVIRNIRLVAVNLSSRGSSTGGLIGYHRGTVSGSYVSGNVTSTSIWDNLGGLVGNNQGTISSSYSAAHVSAGYRLASNVGGLAGYNRGTINGSYATGSVSGSSSSDGVGGLVGGNEGTINGSFAAGSVSSGSGGEDVGGLVGENEGTISSSYAIGNVSGIDDNIGGLVGKNDEGVINASYSLGLVSGSDATVYIGGLLGYNDGGTIAASYWNTQTSGQIGSDGGVGKTTHELQSPTTNTGIYSTWNADWWDFGASNQYPVLKYGTLNVAAQR